MDRPSRPPRGPGAALIAIGVVFLAIGSAGPHAFLPIGVVFIVIGGVLLARARSAGGA